MGSPESAYDHRLPWLDAELEMAEVCSGARRADVGICFGSQLLARALGGQVYRNSTAEIGWTEVQTLQAQWAHKGPWLDFHFDAFTPPPGSTLLAKTDLAPRPTAKASPWGVQFHPEIDAQMFDTWTHYWRNTEEGQRFLASAGDLPERMRAEIQEKEAANRANCRLLLQDFLAAI